MGKLQLNDFISTGKLKEVKMPWQRYLEGKTLILFEFEDRYNLLAIKGEKGLDGLCKYAWEYDSETAEESGYESLENFIEDVNLGNDGFGFKKNEIELCNIETLKRSGKMKKREIIDCPTCRDWNKKLRRCNRIGECGDNKGKKGVCWMEPSEGEYK